MTQQQVADLAGLHVQTISRLEGGTKMISFEMLQRLCAALGVTLDELVEMDDDKRHPGKR